MIVIYGHVDNHSPPESAEVAANELTKVPGSEPRPHQENEELSQAIT